MEPINEDPKEENKDYGEIFLNKRDGELEIMFAGTIKKEPYWWGRSVSLKEIEETPTDHPF